MSIYALMSPPGFSRLQKEPSPAETLPFGRRSTSIRMVRMVASRWKGFLRSRSLQRARLLQLETLTEHRLRDLGFLDGRGVQPRDPFRD